MFGWIYLLLLLCIASSIHCDLTPTRFDRQDRDYRPLQFGKRDGYRPLQFGKKSYRPLQFGKRRAYDFSEYTPY
nr:neuropeptide-like protein NLP-12 precursor [Ascaris suum]